MAELLTTATVAVTLGVTPSGVCRAVKRGKLRYTRKLAGLRGGYLFHPDDVEAYLEARRAHRPVREAEGEVAA